MAATKESLAILVSVTNEFGQPRLIATVVQDVLTDDGYLTATTWQYGGYDPGAEYAGLQINAYVGEQTLTGGSALRNADRVWGIRCQYRGLYSIDTAKQAQAIARVLGRIERGLETANRTFGYLADDDYSGHVMRIARILRIRPVVYVANGARSREVTGERYKKVTGSQLQAWVGMVVADIRAGRVREYAR